MEINNPLISIIIPTFNRAHLIGETLDSVLVQTYSNWECIIVDDGSVDNTEEVVKEYVRKDLRFKFFHRPQEHKPGGNGARNYGFKMSSGAYVNWFDSDDLMDIDFLNSKIEPFLRDTDLDYVISKTNSFDKNKMKINNLDYNFDKYYLTHYNFTVQNINWYTPDTMLKRYLACKVFFNENIKRGQEYNFLVKLTLLSENGFFLDKVMTYRRMHENSIKSSYTNTEMNIQAIFLRIETLREIENNTTLKVNLFLLDKIVLGLTNNKIRLSIKEELFVLKKTLYYLSIKAFLTYIIVRLLMFFFKRSFGLRNILKKEL